MSEDVQKLAAVTDMDAAVVLAAQLNVAGKITLSDLAEAFARHRKQAVECAAKVIDERARISRECGGLTNHVHADAFDYAASALRAAAGEKGK